MPRSQPYERPRRLLQSAGAALLLLIVSACPLVPAICAAGPAGQHSGQGWISGPTRLSRLSPEEKRLLLGFRPSAESAKRPRYRLTDPHVSALLFAAGLPLPKTDDLPASWDWREHQGVTPIKDQGLCGSCWAFCSVGAIEGCAYINDHIVHDLSEQQMLSCNDDGYGCRGGEMASCYEIFRDYGAIAEEDMPYLAADGIPCRQEEAEPLGVNPIPS